nr:AAA family ATPase [Mucilaginibacter sp. L294]
MNTEAKQQIKNDLSQFVQQVGGQMAASRRFVGVSNATISNIINDKWDNIADGMWLSIQNQLAGFKEDWVIDHSVRRMRMMPAIYSDAMKFAEFFFVVAKEGSGKSEPAKHFAKNENVFILKAKDYLNRKTFLAEMLAAMDKNHGGYTIYEMMDLLVEAILRFEHPPVFIIDEGDKLSDLILYFFITIYNETEGKCSIVIQATEYLKKRIIKGVEMNKKGYRELYSRGGRRFIELPDNTNDEIKGIIRLNGVSDEATVNRIANDSEGDIRRVKRLVKAYKAKKEAA